MLLNEFQTKPTRLGNVSFVLGDGKQRLVVELSPRKALALVQGLVESLERIEKQATWDAQMKQFLREVQN